MIGQLLQQWFCRTPANNSVTLLFWEDYTLVRVCGFIFGAKYREMKTHSLPSCNLGVVAHRNLHLWCRRPTDVCDRLVSAATRENSLAHVHTTIKKNLSNFDTRKENAQSHSKAFNQPPYLLGSQCCPLPFLCCLCVRVLCSRRVLLDMKRIRFHLLYLAAAKKSTIINIKIL